MMGWHKLQDRRWDELPLRSQLFRAVDRALLRRAYEKAVNENPALERLFGQEQAQAVVQMNLNAKNYSVAAEPMSNIYGALYSTLATDDPSQRKSMRYIGSCIGRVFYLLDKASRVEEDRKVGRYNVFLVNGINEKDAAMENARRQALAFWVSWALQRRRRLCGAGWTVLGLLTLLFVWALFLLFTFRAPDLPLFVDPRTGTRGRI